MTPQDARRERDELIRRYGAWTAHNIRLAEGVYTIGPPPSGDEDRTARALQVIADCARTPLDAMRVLDIGCLEGGFALELAAQGATAVGLEGREEHLAKARLAARATGVEGVEFVQGDARELSEERHGRFDVVVCVGLLYHLADAEPLDLLDRIAAVTDDLLLLDTHVALRGRRDLAHRGRTYRGLDFVEHSALASGDEREGSRWASLDNDRSFWPTLPSLVNALVDAGFSSVMRVDAPPGGGPPDRVMLVCRKGTPVALRTVDAPAVAPPRVPERTRRLPPRNQLRSFNLAKRLVLDARAVRARRRHR